MATSEYLSYAGLSYYDGKAVERQTNAIAEALKSAKDYTDELKEGQVKTNADAIAKLDGADTVEGSVKAQIKAAKEELEGKITSSAYDDSAIKADIAANTSAIETLNGTGVGSVDKKVADAVASIVADAPESYDTLKEISDWISGHESDASAMNSAIQANKTDIANLVKLVGSLPEGTAAKTIVEYVDSKVAAVDFTEAIATAKKEAVDDAKAYADGLAVNYATADQGAKADTALQEADVATLRTDVAGNKTAISGIDTRVTALENEEFTAITNEQIDGLFAAKA